MQRRRVLAGRGPPGGPGPEPGSASFFDNNGVIVMLPGVPPGGSISANGYLVLGIGTQTNNSPSGVDRLSGRQQPERPQLRELHHDHELQQRLLQRRVLQRLSRHGIERPLLSLEPIPTGDGGEWFDPPSLLALSATNTGYPSGPSGGVQFQVGNYDSLTSSSNNVFSDIAGRVPTVSSTGGFPSSSAETFI